MGMLLRRHRKIEKLQESEEVLKSEKKEEKKKEKMTSNKG